jgi:uncharacterized membrane protein
MRNEIPRVFLLCAAMLLLAACPRSPQSPPASADTPVATAQEPAPMNEPASTPATPPPGTQGKRAAGQENEPLMAWRAFGTEPFWNARVDGATLIFSTPEDQAGRSMHGRRVPSLVGFVYIGKDGDKEFNLDIRPGECSDGMSDNRYEYVANFIYGETTYKGCAEAAK